jgi:hypothetical protein
MKNCTMNQVMAFLSLSDGEFGIARLNDGLLLSVAHVQALVDVDPSGCRKAVLSLPGEVRKGEAEAAYSRAPKIRVTSKVTTGAGIRMPLLLTPLASPLFFNSIVNLLASLRIEKSKSLH